MVQKNSIAVVIVNWNSGSCLRDCLGALSRQTRRPERIIVVDNASADDSLNGIREIYREAEIVALKENRGFAAANNLAIKKADNCGWIALLNPDAFPRPDWLEKLLGAANEFPQFSFFGSLALNHPDNSLLDGAGDVYHVGGLAWRRGHGRPVASCKIKRQEIFAPCAAAALYRRDALLEAEGFDESFFNYFEDVDLAFRLRHLGRRCLLVPESVVAHIGSASLGKQSDFAVYHGHRNQVWSYFKNMPFPWVWIYLPQRLLADFAALVWFAFRGQGIIILRAKWDAVFDLPRVWRERKKIQAGRKSSFAGFRKLMAKGWLTPYLKNFRKP